MESYVWIGGEIMLEKNISRAVVGFSGSTSGYPATIAWHQMPAPVVNKYLHLAQAAQTDC